MLRRAAQPVASALQLRAHRHATGSATRKPLTWDGMDLQRLRTLNDAVAHKKSRLRATDDSESMPLELETSRLHLVGRAVNALAMNQYMVACKSTGAAAFVDCGASPTLFLNWAETYGYKVEHILLTHGHPDHVAGLAETARVLPDAKIYLHAEDVPTMNAAPDVGAVFGLDVEPPPQPHVLLEDGQTIRVGDLEFEAIHTPGHSLGHVCFLEDRERVLFSGDLLFRGSVGRTDIPGADSRVLHDSLIRLLQTIPHLDTSIFPGHLDATTLDRECHTNYFLKPLANKHRMEFRA